MNKSIKDQIEDASYNYCANDAHPTGFSGFNSGAIYGMKLIIELIESNDDLSDDAYAVSIWIRDRLKSEGFNDV